MGKSQQMLCLGKRVGFDQDSVLFAKMLRYAKKANDAATGGNAASEWRKADEGRRTTDKGTYMYVGVAGLAGGWVPCCKLSDCLRLCGCKLKQS